MVIDVWPQDPRLVEESARFFQHKTNHYIFISSIAAYHDYKVMNITETYSTKEGEEFVEGHYGTNKAICERIIQKYFPINHTVIRPGSIVGDRDPSYGFRYWTWKIKRGGSILAPSGMNETIQFVDVTDVAKWVQKCLQNNHYGFYNLVGPERKTTFHSFLLDCQKELNADATFIFVSNEFIKANNINTRQSLPLWNSFDSDFPGFENLSNEKVKALGMKFKSVQACIRDSFNDYSSAYKFGDRENYAGLSESEESALIQKWQTENTQKQ